MLELVLHAEVVGETCDGRAAVQLVQRTAPHLVSLDVGTPHLRRAVDSR